jgi:hypothetical protein
MKAPLKVCLSVALCLLLFPVIALAAPPQPKGKLVYEDNFSDPKKSGLEDNLTAADFSRGFHAPGVYHLKDIKPGKTQFVIFPKQTYADFTLQIDLNDNSDDFNGDVMQGVIVRSQDVSHFYAVIIDPRKGDYSVRKQDGANKTTDLIAAKASTLIKKEAEVNQLRVDAAGDTFTIYLNGEQLDTFKDATYKQGGIGLIAANVDAPLMHMHFDNVKVYSDAAAAPAANASSAPAAMPSTGRAEGTAPLAIMAFALALLLLGLWVRQRR